MNNSNEKETQKKIRDIIARSPGLHISKIAELLDMKISEVAYHLEYLEEKGVISVSKDTSIERYYIEDSRVKTRDKRSLETRREIYNVVAQNPGLYLSKIAEMVGMSVPLTDYHLVFMEKNGDIVIIKDAKGYFKRYYIADSGIDSSEKKILEMLGKKTPLKIVLFLLKHNHLQHKDLMKLLNMSSSKLSYHLTNLLDSEIVEARPHGVKKGYMLKNKDQIVRILQKYKFHIVLDVAVDDFKDLWRDFSYQDMMD